MPNFNAAANFLDSTMMRSNDLISSETILDISNDLIDDSPLNQGIPITGIESLANSMKIDGLLEPIVVYKKDSGRYEIVSGHRRRRAWCGSAPGLGHTTIKCRVLPYEEDPMTRFRQHAEANTQTREKDDDFWCAEIRHARELVTGLYPDDKEDDRLVKISRLLDPKGQGGISKMSIRRYEAYDSLIPQMKVLRKYGLSAFTMSAAAFQHLNESQQKELADYISALCDGSYDADKDTYMHQVTRSEFVSLVKKLKEKGTLSSEKGKGTKPRLPLEDRIISSSGGIKRALQHVKTDEEKEKARSAIRLVREELDKWEKEYLK